MNISVMTVTFHLQGCCSLKEKRRRMGGMRDRFGRQTNVAVCESWYQDEHHLSEWSFVATGCDQSVVSATLDKIQDKLESEVDAQITDIKIEAL